jgi:hypothetical protein
MSPETITQILEQHSPALMNLVGVAGVAEGRLEGEPCVVVFVAHLTDSLRSRIEETLPGCPLRIESTGAFYAGDR